MNPLDPNFEITPMNHMGRNPDDALFVRFYSSPQYNKLASDKEQRPIYEDVDHIEIRRPGSPNPLFEGEVRDKDKVRFARQWQAYKAKEEQQIIGSRIEMWPQVTTVQVAVLKHLNIFTVEQLAAADDLAIQKIGMGGRELHEKAKVYLKLAKETGVPQKLAAENLRLKEELEQVRKDLAELKSIVKSGK